MNSAKLQEFPTVIRVQNTLVEVDKDEWKSFPEAGNHLPEQDPLSLHKNYLALFRQNKLPEGVTLPSLNEVEREAEIHLERQQNEKEELKRFVSGSRDN